MPLYEYKCPACGDFELIRKFSDAPLAHCPTCGAPVQKLLSAPAFQFKGTGWYVTDYAKKSGAPSSSSDSGKSEGGEGKKVESKAETASASSEAKPSAPSSKSSD